MSQKNIYKKKSIHLLMLTTLSLFLCSASCSNSTDGGDDPQGALGNIECSKCIDHKPAPTTFSTTLNNINHSISLEQAITMIQNFNNNKDAIVSDGYPTADVLPVYETFNLKAIDSIICQPNTIGFRVYMAMDNQQKVRFVLVGVDGDGKDVTQRVNNDPAAVDRLAENTSIYVAEAGQRWP